MKIVYVHAYEATGVTTPAQMYIFLRQTVHTMQVQRDYYAVQPRTPPTHPPTSEEFEKVVY
jgi:hypothetical protein